MKKSPPKRRVNKFNQRMHEINSGGKMSAGGHEDVAYGMFDRPGPTDSDEENFGVDDFIVPVVPTEMVSTQLAVERPPIDDPEYIPNTSKSLALAVGELAKSVPEDQIQKFYETYRAMIEKILADATDNTEDEMTESNLRKRVAAILREASAGGEEVLSKKEQEFLSRQFDDEFGPAEEEEEFDEPEAPEETSLKDIADQTGFAGPSGVKNFLYKLLARIQQFSNIPDDEFDALIEFGIEEYVDMLEQSGLVDAEDAAFMSKNRNHVSTLPSFKYFLFHAMILPTAKEIEKKSRDALKKQLDRIGLSANVQASVVNQLIGEVPRNDALIRSRLKAEVDAGKMKPAQARALADEIANKFSALQKLAQGGDDFAEIALQKYAKLDKKKVMAILRNASDDPNVGQASAM
jgi:hypothetical protein